MLDAARCECRSRAIAITPDQAEPGLQFGIPDREPKADVVVVKKGPPCSIGVSINLNRYVEFAAPVVSRELTSIQESTKSIREVKPAGLQIRGCFKSAPLLKVANSNCATR